MFHSVEDLVVGGIQVVDQPGVLDETAAIYLDNHVGCSCKILSIYQ
jgi:hypothetical protein